MKKMKVSLSLPAELIERIDALAEHTHLTRSECVARLVSATLGEVLNEANARESSERIDELLVTTYAVQAMLHWYLPQAFGETQGRADMVGHMSLCGNTEYFRTVGQSMAHNGGNLAAALADSASSSNGFALDWQANDFEDRADFASFYREAATQVESDRAQRAEGRSRNGKQA